MTYIVYARVNLCSQNECNEQISFEKTIKLTRQCVNTIRKHFPYRLFKVIKNILSMLTGPPVFYYLNVDRCAYYWGYGLSGNNIGGHKYVGGPKLLSTNKTCNTVYKLNWTKYTWCRVSILNRVPRCTWRP